MSQFIEMFGTPFSPKYHSMELGDICQIKSGTTFKADEEKLEGDVPYSKVADMNLQGNEIYLRKSTHYVDCNVAKDFYLPKGTVIFPKRGAAINTNKKRILQRNTCVDLNIIGVIPSEKICSIYLYWYFRCIDLSEICDNSGIPQINNKHLIPLTIGVPPLAKQNEFEQIFHQADKSEFDEFKSQFIEMFGNPLSAVQKYPLKRLGDCCELNPRRQNLGLEDTDKVSFVPMPSVSENGYLMDVVDEEYGKVKKGFTYFENGDVLFAKITPCMENGKGAIAIGLTNNIGIGSTEFHVLRPIEGVSNPYWLLALTRLPIFRERANKNMTGTGGQKRVPANYLDNFMVGLPPIEEQNLFENINKQADKSESDILYGITSLTKNIKTIYNGIL